MLRCVEAVVSFLGRGESNKLAVLSVGALESGGYGNSLSAKPAIGLLLQAQAVISVMAINGRRSHDGLKGTS